MERRTSPAAKSAELPPLRYRDESDDEAEIRFSLTALGELAVARSDRAPRGRRFRGFGPCRAVA